MVKTEVKVLLQGEQGADPALSPGPSNSGITTPDTDSPNSARNSLMGKDGPASTRVHFAEDPDTNGVAGELSPNTSSASLGIPQVISLLKYKSFTVAMLVAISALDTQHLTGPYAGIINAWLTDHCILQIHLLFLDPLEIPLIISCC